MGGRGAMFPFQAGTPVASVAPGKKGLPTQVI